MSVTYHTVVHTLHMLAPFVVYGVNGHCRVFENGAPRPGACNYVGQAAMYMILELVLVGRVASQVLLLCSASRMPCPNCLGQSLTAMPPHLPPLAV